MNYLVLLVFSCICSTLDAIDTEYDKYLNEVSDTFISKDGSTTGLQLLSSIIFDKNYKHAIIMPLVNSTYILLGSEVFEILHDTYEYNFSLERVSSTATIAFAKFIEYDGRTILMVKLTSGEAFLYSFVPKGISFIQALPAETASDAHFFINKGNLYLIVLNNKSDNLSETSLYKWLGSHFDEIQTIFTIGAVKVSSFTAGKYEILIILQAMLNKNVTYSKIYRFQDDNMIEIQRFQTNDPINLITFKCEKMNGVIVFQKSQINEVYVWNGEQLHKTISINTDADIETYTSLQAYKKTFLIVPENDYVQVYQLCPKNIKVTKYHTSNYSVILDIGTREIGNNITTFIAGSKENNQVEVDVFSFNIDSEDSVDGNKKYMLADYYNELTTRIFAWKHQQTAIREKLERYSRESRLRAIPGENLKRASSVDIQLENVTNKLINVESLVKNHTSQNITINGVLIINGNVTSDKLLGKNITIKILNNRQWIPQQWLKYEELQTITSPVKMTSVTVKTLETSSEDPNFKDWLLKHGNQTISGSVNVTTLKADTITTTKINDIFIDDIYRPGNNSKIKSKKHFPNVTVNEATIQTINGQNSSELFSYSKQSFANHVLVENLHVETINDIDWNNFTESVFRFNSSNTINGSLTMQKIKAVTLTTTNLNGVDTKNFLTTSTNQTIETEIEFNRIFSQNIAAGVVNGFSLIDDVVFLNKNASVIGPVTIDKLNVAKDLKLSDEIEESFLERSGHIIGTNESDLLQIYHGKVRIKGNLVVKNVTLQPNSRLLVQGNEVQVNISNNYWTKDTKQVFPVHVTAYSGVRLPHVLTKQLNDVNFNQYMVNQDTNSYETSYIFDNITIIGDVILHDTAKHKPDLNKLVKEAVNVSGSFVINGEKNYRDTLKVDSLIVSELEGVKTTEILNKTADANITGMKYFKNLVVKADVTSFVEHADRINNIDLKNFLNNIITINDPQKLDSMDFKSLQAENIYVKTLNGHQITDYTDKINQLKALNRINKMKIKGDATFVELNNVSTLNNIEVTHLLKSASASASKYGGIVADVIFKNRLKVENLVTAFIEDINLREQFTKFLFKTGQQNITAPYSFTNLKAANIVTPRINEFNANNLIDISRNKNQEIFVPNGLKMHNVKLMKSLNVTAMHPCNIKRLVKKIESPDSQQWRKITIKQNVTLLDIHSPIYRIFENTVKINGENIIYAPVHFKNGVKSQSIVTKKDVNNINITEIIEDAVLIDSRTEQVIHGRKWFNNLKAKQVQVMKNCDIPIVNNENINQLSHDIVDKNSINNTVIKGIKTFFEGLQTNKLYTKLISNVNPDLLVNLKQLRKVPRAVFDTVKVSNNFDFTFVDNFNFTQVANNRLLLRSPNNQEINAVYHFDNIEIRNLRTPSVNNISLDNVVFNTDHFKNISSHKTFLNDVVILGDLDVDLINGCDISKEYQNSASNKDNLTVYGSIDVLNDSEVNGVISTKYINGYPISAFYEILNNTNTKSGTGKIQNIQSNLSEKIRQLLPVSQELPKEYMYLEKSDSMQISISNVSSASIVTTYNYVLIHVNVEESGEYCGLPIYCQCTSQYTIEISPDQTVNVFPNKGIQKVFSYHDNLMTVYFVTNTVSTSANCRRDERGLTNEYSLMTWSTVSMDNKSGNFYQHSEYFEGYIRKVEFFTINGKSYAIIGRYYNPINDTYDVESLVIRFNENRTSASEIQRIKTNGLQELHVFYASQGVVLVAGNVRENEEETNIYIFNEQNEQFDHLREVPFFGCSEAKEIVLSTESLIVLRHEKYPIQILKYNHEYKNYYHYDNFERVRDVIGLSVFYIGNFGLSDVYMCLVTSKGQYYIYSYRFIEGWVLESNGFIDGLRNFIPFNMQEKNYLFASSSTNSSSILTIVKNDSF